MKIGRQISPSDMEILRELQTHYSKDRIKIDLDILSEPCIFYKYLGDWEFVYKLSKDGNYIRPRRFYVVQIHKAIQSYCDSRYQQYLQSKINYEEERRELEKTKQVQKEFQDKGFRDNLPTE